VHQLRERGHPIEGALVSRKGKTFAVYWMTVGGRREWFR
jgi:hypothetical protein